MVEKSIEKKKQDGKPKKTKTQKVFSVIYNVFSILFIMVCSFLCFSVIISRIVKTPPCIAGVSVVRISSGSMEESGFEVGKYIAIKQVNTKTLNVGDEIAFFTYSESIRSFDLDTCSLVKPESIGELEFKSSFLSFIGVPKSEHIQAGKAGSQVVFHEIVRVLEDDNGDRWFQTKGTSNQYEDSWFIAENMVVGAYSEGPFANGLAKFLGTITNSSVLLIIIIAIPICLLMLLVLKDIIKSLKIAIIENQIVEGKKKITDEYCVERKIGSNLSDKEKYKVLEYATEDEKVTYINLLWLDKKPDDIQKLLDEKENTNDKPDNAV